MTHPRAPRRSDISGAEAGPQPPARSPEPAPTPAPGPAPSAIPYDLLDVVRRAHGIDVSDVPIHRGPEVAGEAGLLGARSYTRDAEVFLPAHEGSPDGPVARGLLAHELTHAAQQRTLGSMLPAEDTEAGRVLEAQAVAAERWARGMGPDPATGGGFGGFAAPGNGASQTASWTAPWLSASAAGVQRQAGDVTTVAEPEHTAAQQPASAIGAGSATEPQTAQAAPPTDHELGAARDKLLDLSKRRPLDLDDPGDIEELAVRIYQRIHRRLRRDLVVDRERAGRLGESGPFGAAR